MMMKAISQPNSSAKGGMLTGAARAPTEAPALKMEVAKARSFFGKYSAVTLMAAGKLPASPMARTARQNRNRYTETVAMASAVMEPASTAFRAAIESMPSICMVTQPQAACRQAPNDHTKIDHR